MILSLGVKMEKGLPSMKEKSDSNAWKKKWHETFVKRFVQNEIRREK